MASFASLFGSRASALAALAFLLSAAFANAFSDYSAIPDYSRAPVIDLAEQKQAVQVDWVLVIDRSGSMADGNRLQRARQACQTLTRDMATDSLPALVVFNSAAQTVADFDAGKDALDKAVSSISANGGTAIAKGLEQALQLLANRPSASRHILLISDGEDKHDVGPIIARLRAENIAVTAIGMGLAKGDRHLKRIAGETGGVFQIADDLNLIQTMFAAMGARRLTLIAHHGLITAGDRQRFPFVLERAMPAGVNLYGQNSWSGKALQLRLLHASGDSLVSSITVTDSQADFESFAISGLAAGRYVLEVSAPDGNEEVEPFHLTLSGDAQKSVSPPSLPSEMDAGTKVDLPLRVDGQLANAELQTWLPDGRSRSIFLGNTRFDANSKTYGIAFEETSRIGFYDMVIRVDDVPRNRIRFRIGTVEEVVANRPEAASWLRQAAWEARQRFETEPAPAEFNQYSVTAALASVGGCLNRIPDLVAMLEQRSGDRIGALRDTTRLIAVLTERLPLVSVGLVQGDRMYFARGNTNVRTSGLPPAMEAGLMRPGAFFESRVLIPLDDQMSLLLQVNDGTSFESDLHRPDAVAEPPYRWGIVDRALAYQLARNLAGFYASVESLRLRERMPFATFEPWVRDSMPRQFGFMSLEIQDASGKVYFQDRNTLLEPSRMAGVVRETVEAPIQDLAGNPAGKVRVSLAALPRD